MRDVIVEVEQWLAAGKAVALATVVQTWGSSPRQVGAKMACTLDNEIAGSVSGGCVEGAVVEAGKEVLATAVPQLLHFGVADETAWEVGLACGGSISVWVEPVDDVIFPFLRQHVHDNQPVTSVTLLGNGRKLAFNSTGRRVGDLGEWTDTAVAQAQTLTHSQRITLAEGVAAFVDVLRPAPQLVLVGGVHIAVALAAIAKTLDYRVTVIDPRRAFSSIARFPHVDRLIQAWPGEALAAVDLGVETAVALLSHDPKIDDPTLKILLNSPVKYIGALGSQKTHAARVQRLHEMGFDEAAIARIHAPIGLDIGAQTPAEIALSIMAEIVSQRGSVP
ncbi:MAG: XdhC family protein [Ardenticatenaceae bacterium]|nr:XdhC family protein [Ardenticatenaceae bacterium]MCB9004403.1 XdhC family protein [Ardenticatenaceae bacterium]